MLALSGKSYSLVGAQEGSEQTAQTVGARIGPLLGQQAAEFVVTPACPFYTHTASSLARVLETQGLSAVILLALVRESQVKVRPPRSS